MHSAQIVPLAALLKKLPPGCRAGDNAYPFIGGFRMWETEQTKPAYGRRSELWLLTFDF
jgi:hypothetical protein